MPEVPVLQRSIHTFTAVGQAMIHGQRKERLRGMTISPASNARASWP